MKRNFNFRICFIFVFLIQLCSAQLFPVNKSMKTGEYWADKFGYINSTGKLYAPYIYEYAYEFSDSLGLVYKYDKDENEVYGFVNQFGQEAVPLIYSNAMSFRNGYAIVQKDDKTFIIDKKANKYMVDNVVFNRRNFVSEGLVIFDMDGKKGYKNLKNEIIVPAEFDIAIPFSEGFGITIKDAKIILVDKTGKQFKTDYIDAASPISNGFLPVKNASDKWGVVNTKLETLIDFKYDYISDFCNGYAAFELEKKMGMFNEKGEIVIPANYSFISPFSEGRVFALTTDQSLILMDGSFKELKKFTTSDTYSKFTHGVCSIVSNVTDPKNVDENIRNYGGMANKYVNAKGDIIWQSETYYSCFPANSLVKMADFSTKNIQDIQSDDEVMTYNQETKMNEASKVLKLEIHEGKFDLIELEVSQTSNSTCSVSDNQFLKLEKLTATPNHPILTKTGVRPMSEIAVNDLVFVWNESSQAFDELKVESVNTKSETKIVYNLKTTSRNYIVNSVVVMMK